LFWDHFSARVRQAIFEQPPKDARWRGWPRVTTTLVAGIVLVIALGVGVNLARLRHAPPQTPSSMTEIADTTDVWQSSEDASLQLVADLTADMDWEESVQAGLGVWPGSADHAFFHLSAEERQELGRLLKTELQQSGS
jgi:hypothetical protein